MTTTADMINVVPEDDGYWVACKRDIDSGPYDTHTQAQARVTQLQRDAKLDRSTSKHAPELEGMLPPSPRGHELYGAYRLSVQGGQYYMCSPRQAEYANINDYNSVEVAIFRLGAGEWLKPGDLHADLEQYDRYFDDYAGPGAFVPIEVVDQIRQVLTDISNPE